MDECILDSGEKNKSFSWSTVWGREIFIEEFRLLTKTQMEYEIY